MLRLRWCGNLSMIEELKNLPEISFIDNMTLEDVHNKLLTDYAEEYERITGQSGVLNVGDPKKIVLNSCGLLFYQMLMFIDRAGKSNLLGYSYGDFLDVLAATRGGLIRKESEYAQVTLRFNISNARSEATGIPGGSRATDGNGHYFATKEYAEIPADAMYVDVDAESIDSGMNSNGLPVGTVNIIVDTLPYIESVINISESKGGADVESDESLTRRIFFSPGQYSTAGSETAYEYHAMAFRSDVMDVKAYKSNDMEITVLFLLTDGSLPEVTDISEMKEYLSQRGLKASTDLIVVSAPTEISYDINLKYYINKSDSNKAAKIQSDVNSAVEDYISWQRHIARDINPSELIHKIKSAGAKRVELISPVYTAIDSKSVAKLNSMAVTYGGLEDD